VRSASKVADVVAVGDLRGAFEAVDRLVQAGHDLRNVTGDLLAHFRNLLLVQTAPTKRICSTYRPTRTPCCVRRRTSFTPGELSRVLELLLAAQTDMRWTTSATANAGACARACIARPETDPTPAGVVARLERLERLANVSAGSVSPKAERRGPVTGRAAGAEAQSRQGGRRRRPRRRSGCGHRLGRGGDAGHGSRCGRRWRQLPVPHAADASSVDVTMLRRSWGSVIQHLGERKQAVLRALMESATPTAFDGTTLEIAFPPTFKNTSSRSRAAKQLPGGVAGALRHLTEISCVVRESRAARRHPREPSKRTTRPATTQRHSRGSKRCSAPSRVTDEKA
jgi:hypothetical protein